MDNIKILKITKQSKFVEMSPKWFSARWGIPEEEYRKSVEQSLTNCAYPKWYVAVDDDKIVGGLGVIENDFHSREDLSPNVCAVYVEPTYRKMGLAGKLLNFVCQDMAKSGVNTLYLVTDHVGFYERYGWEYICDTQCLGESNSSRVYVHKTR